MADGFKQRRIEKLAVGLAVSSPVGLLATLFALVLLPKVVPKSFDLINIMAWCGSWLMVATCSAWLFCFVATLFTGGARRPAVFWLVTVLPLVTLLNPLTMLITACTILHACV